MRRFWLLLPLLLLTTVHTLAQSRRDSVDTHEWAAKVTGEEGQLQPRFLPKGDSISLAYQRASRWYNKFRIGLGTGYDGQYNKNQTSYSIPINVMLAYQLSPVHALQGKLSYAELHRKQGRDVRSAALELDYFFNFTNYTRGSSINRLLTFSGFVGIGGRITSNRGVKERSPYGVIGGEITLYTGNNVSMSFQPYVGVIRDQPYLYREQNTTFYEIMYGVNANLQLDFMRPRFYGRKNVTSRFFIEASQGVTLPLNANEPTSVGSAYTFSFGYWPSRIMGFRLGAHAQDYFWDKRTTAAQMKYGQQLHAEHTARQRASFVGGRLEVLLSPFSASAKWRQNKYFDWNVSGGMEVGKFGQAGGGLLIRYTGATMGTQVLFKVPKTDNAMLFIEPRYTWLFYNIPYSNTYNKRRYKEHFTMISAGVRLSRDIHGKSVGDSTFVNDKYHEPGHFFGSLSWGDMRIITRGETYTGNHKLNNSIVGSFGRDFCPWATALLQVDYSQKHTVSQHGYDVTAAGVAKHYNGMWNINYHSLSVRLLYQLRLNNLIGYHHTRQRFQLSLLTGPVYCVNLKGKINLAKGEMAGGLNPQFTGRVRGSHSTFAWAGGLQARYYVTDNWSVFVEPMGQVNVQKSFDRLYVYDNIGLTYSF